MQEESDVAKFHDPPRTQRLAPWGITRPQALLRCAAILDCAAVLIVVVHRGLFDLDDETRKVISIAGPSLAVFGLLYFFYIWGSGRFRVSIGRVMVFVAAVAVFLQIVLSFRPR
jgi:hypothetical protein